jgi:glycogen synthase
MHLLVTADTVGGVWTYTQELVTGLISRGHHVSLISFGKLPTPDQTLWMSSLPRLDYRATEFRLEWMQNAERDILEAADYLRAVISEVRPDLLHFNQFAFGALDVEVPRIVVAHSDVLSWWLSVHREVPPTTGWLAWYRDTVSKGLRGATVVVTPSNSMLSQLQLNFEIPVQATVITNGRDPGLFDPSCQKVDRVITVGRLWDEGKQVTLLAQHKHPMPVWIVGPSAMDADGISHEAATSELHFTGVVSQRELRVLLAESSVYAATSCYEPFGLAPLEAALSGCALVCNDIPVFHELWGDTALYFRHNDAQSLAECIALLAREPELRKTYAQRAYQRACERFTTDAMMDRYEALYQTVASVGACA